jgi:hypothetical protein
MLFGSVEEDEEKKLVAFIVSRRHVTRREGTRKKTATGRSQERIVEESGCTSWLKIGKFKDWFSFFLKD